MERHSVWRSGGREMRFGSGPLLESALLPLRLLRRLGMTREAPDRFSTCGPASLTRSSHRVDTRVSLARTWLHVLPACVCVCVATQDGPGGHHGDIRFLEAAGQDAHL